MTTSPEWKLPVGTSQAVWDYTQSRDLARQYDSKLAGTPLLDFDLRFAERFFLTSGTLVDLGCGTGRLLLSFARRGCSALGIDLSAEMLKVAAEKARSAGIMVPLIRANLVELDCLTDGRFDYASCLFSTLGMISGRADRCKVLIHVRRILKPGGRFLLHVHNLWFHLGTRAGRRWLLRDRFSALAGNPTAGDYSAPQGVALHHFSRREILNDLRSSGFKILTTVPVSLRPDCRLPLPWLLSGFRAYGFLIGAERR
jgi:SAM-dependent methyltransferase